MAASLEFQLAAALNAGDGTTIHLLPLAVGSFDEDDRMMALDLFIGADVVDATPVAGPSPVTMVTILSGEPLPRLPVVLDPEVDKFHRDLINYLRRLSGLMTDTVVFASGAMGQEEDNFWSDVPESKTYTLIESAAYVQRLNSITLKTRVGTVSNFEVRVDGVALTGTGTPAISTSQSTFTFNNNRVRVGQKVELVLSGTAPAINDLGITLRKTRLVGVIG